MLKTRIQILEQGNVISKEVADYVNEVIDVMYAELEEFDMQKAEMFTTHIAMATQRVCNNEEVKDLDEDTWAEIIKSESYEKASAFSEKILKKAPVQCPESEKRFILLHLCNLLEK